MRCEKFLEKVEEKTGVGFSISKNGDNGYLVAGEYWSDLGEDVIISLVIDKLTKEKIVHAMYEYQEYFDAEEHAVELFNLHGKYGTPTSIRDLLEDANEQKQNLEDIYYTMAKIYHESEV